MINRKKNVSATATKPKSDRRLSKENYEFDVFEDIWTLDANITLNFALLSPLNLDPAFTDNFRLAIADYACGFSASYTRLIFSGCRKLFSQGVLNEIREEHILNFKSTLSEDKEWLLGGIRAFIIDWYEKEWGGVEKNVVTLLQSLKIKGTERGKAVATGCPYSGAYTFDEQLAFINWYVNAYTEKVITLEEYAFIMALQQTGARPIQLAYLYFSDLVTRVENGIEHYDLSVPHAKKRREGIRKSFHLREDVSEDLMLVLYAQAKQSIKTVEKRFNVKLIGHKKNIVPVFLDCKSLSEVKSFDEFEAKTRRNPDFFCLKKSGYSYLALRISRVCPLKTSRINIDGEHGDLHINPRRFRYTHATNMSIMGASSFAIAKELGHADIQYVKVYTEFTEEVADRIDEALAPSLVPLAQAFSGTLIDSEKDAIRANDPRSLINNPKGDAVGNCGTFGFCANGTVHCYTCNKFQPWLHGRHHEVLSAVMSERDSKRKMGATEFILQSHNRSIEAIQVVIQKCEERKKEIQMESAIDV